MAWTRAALALGVAAVLAALALSGGDSSDPRTPPALPGLPPPYLTVGVLGEGELTAGVDAYGDVVDLRDGPAGPALIENSLARQRAGTVPIGTGIVPRASIGGRQLPFWRADSVRQHYLPGAGVLVTTAHFGAVRARIECAAGKALGCVVANGLGRRWARVSFDAHVATDTRRLHFDDRAAWRIVSAAVVADRRRLDAARPLGAGAPAWARRLYARSLLVLWALTDARTGAVAAGARDGWAYVWPRDAGATAIALAGAGYRRDARRVASFLSGLDLDAAARFDGDGVPVAGRAAQGDAWGWAAATAHAAGLPRAAVAHLEHRAHESWRDRADYQEKSPGEYLGNALASADGPKTRVGLVISARRRGGLARRLDDPGSGLDSAAAWAVRPFPRPALFGAARRTLLRLMAEGGRFGIVPSQDWPDEDPWTAPTAWSAWSLAALSARDRSQAAALRDRAASLRLLRDLRRAETPAGLLPERVDARTGQAASTTPLAWSHAFAVLAIRRLWPSRQLSR